MKQPISDATILIKPSNNLFQYLKRNKLNVNEKSVSDETSAHQYLTTKEDLDFINSLDQRTMKEEIEEVNKGIKITSTDCVLNIQDLRNIYRHIQNEQSKTVGEQIYLHELLEGSRIILPENPDVPRNQNLEARCQRLKAQQENRKYKAMTKDVDSVCKSHPEDTISYQLKMINRQLIAIFQFIISVGAGFAFGFIGVELMVGNLDFGFRLLLGVACALIIALAELYFLAKKLNEDLYIETGQLKKTAHAKLD